jgi:hypothetical protein
MAKKQVKKQSNALLYIVIGVLLVLAFSNKTTILKETQSTLGTQTITMLDLAPQLPTQSECTFELTPATINSGQSVKGRIQADRLTTCNVYANFNSLGWHLVLSDDTDFVGVLVRNEQLFLAGSWRFAAICGQCITNFATVEVIGSGNDFDGDGIPDEADSDDDNDGYSDAEELASGTNSHDPNSYPGSQEAEGGQCDTYCDGLGYNGGRNVNSYSECVIPPEVPTTDNYGNNCCCMSDEEYTNPDCPGSQVAINDFECDACCDENNWDYGYYSPGPMDECWRDGNCCCYDSPQYPAEPNCDTQCFTAGYIYGGYYSGGVGCDDFYAYLPTPQCCCKGDIPFCQEQCAVMNFDWGTSKSIVSYSSSTCVSYADNWCVQQTGDGYQSALYSADYPCCCWKCHINPWI